jgi:hypothetical protein
MVVYSMQLYRPDKVCPMGAFLSRLSPLLRGRSSLGSVSRCQPGLILINRSMSNQRLLTTTAPGYFQKLQLQDRLKLEEVLHKRLLPDLAYQRSSDRERLYQVTF